MPIGLDDTTAELPVSLRCIHLCEHTPSEPIGEVTMRAALRIGDYLLAHGIEALTGPDERTRRALRC